MSVRRFVVPAELSRERLDKVLTILLTDTSRATVQRWLEEDRVRVDGVVGRARDKVREGTCIEFEPAPLPPSEALPDGTVQFTVLYEDPHLIVVDKPAGLVVHPAKGHDSGTLVNGLLSRYEGHFASTNVEDASDPIEAMRPGIVHRIDKDTSGVLVVARTEAAREGLKEQLQSHSMGRRYLALTIGVPASKTVKTLYGRHPRARLKWSSLVPEGKTAISHFAVLERFGEKGFAALVECRLETGRTHQIRVHLAEQCKTPLLSDSLYGRVSHDPRLAEAANAIGRQALHAESLAFEHPITGEQLAFHSPMPKDFDDALLCLRRAK